MIVRLFCVLLTFTASAAEAAPTESDYYRMTEIPIPETVNLEAGGLEMMPDGRLAVSTRRGDIYMVDGVMQEVPEPDFRLYAAGLHEVLGLAHRDGWLYATQRCELTRIKDVDRDGRADVFQTVSDGWGVSGDYHEYAFGSKFDRDGHLWVVLCLTGSFNANAPYRGWCLRISPAGETIPTCSGIRSPGGVGMSADGEMFYTDNQGPWNGSCSLKHLKPGGFMGHPAGNKFYAESGLGEQPPEPESGSRIHLQRERVAQLVPPAVWFPYKKMGQSASGIAADRSGGKFGPLAGQMFVGDQTFSTVMRVDLEEVNGVYQGACFPFLSGFGSGSLSLLMTDDGALLVGGTKRGWGARGPNEYSLDRVTWTGRIPFEIQTMRVRPDGFVLTFTQPVDPNTAADPGSYRLSTYTYIYQSKYGSPEVDHTEPRIQAAEVAADGRRVHLKIEGLQIGHVHELHASGVRSTGDLPLLHQVAYYTLNELPAK